MSANPFRPSLAQNEPAPPPPASFNTADVHATPPHDGHDAVAASQAPTRPVGKTKKSVRINSPTEIIPPHPDFRNEDDSPISYAPEARHESPSVPAASPSFSSRFPHLPAVDPSYTEQAQSSSSAEPSRDAMNMPEVVRLPSTAPPNPFARTLASLETQGRTDDGLMERDPDASSPRHGSTSSFATAKPSLDVEGFKNLLMTGISSNKVSSAPPIPHSSARSQLSSSINESSSSTDTSSISRHSIVESTPEKHPESPATSYDMAASDEDDNISLTESAQKERKKPPPAPKHRHGKLVTSRTPQTVSFSDFSASEAATSPPPTSYKAGSDFNKPLPPTPPAFTSPAASFSDESARRPSSVSDTPRSETSSISEIQSSQKRAPPPVPLARRQSQLRNSTIQGRARSNSSLTTSSQHSMDFPVPALPKEDSTSSISSQKAPPPPPPSRHRGSLRSSQSTASGDSSTTEIPASSSRSTISPPDPASSRRLADSSEPSSPILTGLARTASTSSSRPPNRSVSNESASSSTMPPPPPPPRRHRGSARSSLDQDRPNLTSLLQQQQQQTSPDTRRISREHKRNSIDSSRRRSSAASQSSLKYEYAPVDAPEHALSSPREEVSEHGLHAGGADAAAPRAERRAEPTTRVVDTKVDTSSSILEDMDKFQREIDELRERYKHAA